MARKKEGRKYLKVIIVDSSDNLSSFERRVPIQKDDSAVERVCGTQVPADRPIPLPGGWNSIAYFPDCPLEPGYALSSIWSDLDIVKNDAGEFCIPGIGCWIECLEPNRGYKVRLSDPATLIYPTDCPPYPPHFAKMPEVRDFARSTHFLHRERTGESYSMVVASVDISGMAPEVGDEIGVFTPSGLCVGAGAWQDEIVGIALWRDDELTDAVDGFRSGERMAFRFWDKSENRELELYASYAKGSGIFAAGPFALLDLSLDAKASQQAAVELKVEQNYPNPFNPATTISFSLPVTSNVSLKIYNLLGREVRTLVDQVMTAGGHSIPWDGKDNSGKLVASGI
jgi:hypothetical protein